MSTDKTSAVLTNTPVQNLGDIKSKDPKTDATKSKTITTAQKVAIVGLVTLGVAAVVLTPILFFVPLAAIASLALAGSAVGLGTIGASCALGGFLKGEISKTIDLKKDFEKRMDDQITNTVKNSITKLQKEYPTYPIIEDFSELINICKKIYAKLLKTNNDVNAVLEEQIKILKTNLKEVKTYLKKVRNNILSIPLSTEEKKIVKNNQKENIEKIKNILRILIQTKKNLSQLPSNVNTNQIMSDLFMSLLNNFCKNMQPEEFYITDLLQQKLNHEYKITIDKSKEFNFSSVKDKLLIIGIPCKITKSGVTIEKMIYAKYDDNKEPIDTPAELIDTKKADILAGKADILAGAFKILDIYFNNNDQTEIKINTIQEILSEISDKDFQIQINTSKKIEYIKKRNEKTNQVYQIVSIPLEIKAYGETFQKKFEVKLCPTDKSETEYINLKQHIDYKKPISVKLSSVESDDESADEDEDFIDI